MVRVWIDNPVERAGGEAIWGRQLMGERDGRQLEPFLNRRRKHVLSNVK